MKKSKRLIRKFFHLTFFSIAMGLLEAIVVVYLRRLYYPQGFQFPLKLLNSSVYGVEFLREIATLVMLFSISTLAGKKFYTRLAYFLFNFAVWDIFYYIWLKLLLNWPASLLDWDILFLIPITWVGPVLSPVIASLVMLGMAGSILYFDARGVKVRWYFNEWVMTILGALIIFFSYIRDYAQLIIQGGFWQRWSSLATDAQFLAVVRQYIPSHYQWDWFGLGIALILIATFLFIRRSAHNLRH